MKRGIFFAVCAGIVSGVSIFYNKQIVGTTLDPVLFNIVKNGFVGLLFTFFLTLSSVTALRRLPLRSWVLLILIAGIGGSIPFVLFFEGLKYTPAISANLIHKTLFLWVLFLAVPFLKERVSKIHLVSYCILTAATFFIGGMPAFTGSKGEWMILSATLLWSVENILAVIALKSIPTHIVVWARMCIGTLFLCLFALVQQKALGTLAQLPVTLLLPITGSGVLLSAYVFFWYRALSRAPATVVTLCLLVATPVTTFLQYAQTITPLSTTVILSQFVLVSGIILIAISAYRPHETH